MSSQLQYHPTPPIQAIIKQYPTFARHYSYKMPYKQPMAGLDDISGSKSARGSFENPIAFVDSVRRSKTRISDIVLSNHFDMFATFTFNGNIENTQKFGYVVTDRTNPIECKNKMSKWLKNQREIHGRFSYLIIPEFHKDNESLHFHALLNNYRGKISPTVQHHGKQLYTIDSYKLGHSDLKHIDQTPEDYLKVASYIKKYITKDMPHFGDKKRYWCSKELIRPQKIINPEMTDEQLLKFYRKYTTSTLTISEALGTIPVTSTYKE